VGRGNVRFGHLEPDGSQVLRFTTDGVSAGVDKRFSNTLVMGAGVGYAKDKTDIGADGSKNETKGATFALYGTYSPTQKTYIDGLVGYASVRPRRQPLRRPCGAFATSSRRGEQWFGSIALATSTATISLLLSPYARLDYAQHEAQAGDGDGRGQHVPHLSRPDRADVPGRPRPSRRVAARHALRLGAPARAPRVLRTSSRRHGRDRVVRGRIRDQYTVTPCGTRRNALLLGLGSDFDSAAACSLGLDYQTRARPRGDVDQSVPLQLTQDLDQGMGASWFAPSTPFESRCASTRSFTYDDNVNRAREAWTSSPTASSTSAWRRDASSAQSNTRVVA
jgi:hypothetical protein